MRSYRAGVWGGVRAAGRHGGCESVGTCKSHIGLKGDLDAMNDIKSRTIYTTRHLRISRHVIYFTSISHTGRFISGILVHFGLWRSRGWRSPGKYVKPVRAHKCHFRCRFAEIEKYEKSAAYLLTTTSTLSLSSCQVIYFIP